MKDGRGRAYSTHGRCEKFIKTDNLAMTLLK
jgi:hypothetical protein